MALTGPGDDWRDRISSAVGTRSWGCTASSQPWPDAVAASWPVKAAQPITSDAIEASGSRRVTMAAGASVARRCHVSSELAGAEDAPSPAPDSPSMPADADAPMASAPTAAKASRNERWPGSKTWSVSKTSPTTASAGAGPMGSQHPAAMVVSISASTG